MRVVIETSIYLLIMSLIGFATIDFVGMNMSISKMNETRNYVVDSLEILGESNGSHELSQELINEINLEVQSEGVSFNVTYYDESDMYDYYMVNLNYAIKSKMFGIEKHHSTNSIVKIEKSQDEL